MQIAGSVDTNTELENIANPTTGDIYVVSDIDPASGMAASGFSLTGYRVSKALKVSPAHRALKVTKACVANRVSVVSRGRRVPRARKGSRGYKACRVSRVNGARRGCQVLKVRRDPRDPAYR